MYKGITPTFVLTLDTDLTDCDVYVTFKQELFKKYGEENEGQLMINRESPNFSSFIKELNELDTEIEIPLMRFTEKDLIDSGLSAKQMSLIWELVDGND